mgnify:CR=1 FL=1
MAKLEVDVKISDMEEFKELIDNTNDLIRQIEIADFEDENGHSLKRNKAYCDLVDSMKNLAKTK